MQKFSLLLLTLALMVFCLPPAESIAQEPTQAYTIRLSRPSKVGDQSHRVIEAASVVTLQTSQAPAGANASDKPADAGSKKPQDFALMVTYRADFTQQVLAVDENGQPTRLKVTFKELTKAVAANVNEKPLQPAGTLVYVEIPANGPTVYTVGDNKTRPDPETHAALKQLIPGQLGPTEDEIYGPGSPKKPGDSWPINMPAFLRKMERDGTPVKPEQVQGKVVFIGVEEVRGVKCARLKIESTITGLQGSNLPQNVAIKSSVLTLSADCPVPLDTAKPEMGRTSQVQFKVVGETDKNGVKSPVIMDVLATRKETF